MGDGPHRLVLVVCGVADPDHGIAAILDDDAADLLQEGRFLLGAHEGLVAPAQRPERPVELSKLFFLLAALRDVDAGAHPFPHAAVIIQDRHAAGQEMPVDPVMPAQAELGLVALFFFDGFSPDGQGDLDVVGMERL